VLVRDGSATDLEQVYRAQSERLYRALLAYSGDPRVAEDALAEAFAQALRNRGQMRDPTRWVWSVSFRLAKGELAQRGRESGELVDTGYDMPEPMRDLLTALAKLSPKQRACIVLFHFADYPVKEIAKMLDTSSAAVKVHLSQGRKRLRVWLSEGALDG
jgi:RNA polymerase sigma-70 factor, ECF subfamily